MFHLLIAEEAVTAGTTDEALDAVGDEVFSRRNNNWFLTEDWYVFLGYAHGTSITAARFNTPILNSYGVRRFWPVERDVDVPDDPAVADMRDSVMLLPRDEEIQIATSNDLGAATEQHEVCLWITSKDRISGRSLVRSLPPGALASGIGEIRQKVRCTATITSVATAWTGFNALTFEQTVRRGTWAVIGAQCFANAPLAFRLNFPRAPFQQNRKLFPGGLCQQAIGEKPLLLQQDGGLGVWGYFASDETPTLSIYSVGAASEACVLYLDLLYISEDTNAFGYR